MEKNSELNFKELYKCCDKSMFKFKTTEELQPIEYLIGQDRALSSINFALDIKVDRYNLYVSGVPGSGRTSSIRKIVEEKAKNEKTPDDIIYVYNFKNPDRPNLIKFPAGRGNFFAKDIDELISTIIKTIPKAFETEDYEKRRNEVVKRFQIEKEKLIEQVDAMAKEKGFLIQFAPTGVLTIPIQNGQPLKPEDFAKLSPEVQKKIQEEGEKLLEEINEVVSKLKKIDKRTFEALKDLDNEVAVFSIGHLLKDLISKYEDVLEVSEYLESLKDDIIENLSFFREPKQPEEINEFLRRYKINVFVDNSKTKGAPVVYEINPTYYNLFGGIDYETKMGFMVTNFNLIKPGSIHRANGGYLIINAFDLLINQFSWDTLKRTLKNKESIIENPLEQLKVVPTVSIKPEPIPIDLKVILIGTPYIYYLLYYNDNDFKKLFRVKADFDTEMDRNEENLQKYINFISNFVKKSNLKQLTVDAVGEVIDYGSRVVEDQNKVTTRFQIIGDLITEANYWADKENSKYIDEKHITKAIEEKEYRSNLIEKKMLELIKDGTILIDVDGEKVGQINGLAIISLGEFEFGRPTKITANISMGAKGVVNIEREVKLSGSIHDKGVMILSGFLGEKYAKDKPLSLSATLTFEQSYEEVEGDSASSAELYALISSIANIPIKQYYAVTGSVNQKGEVQPIGGVNRKIEGFFETCKINGLNGKQGVIIPFQNKKDLMLKKEVVDAVKDGKFHIYAIKTINEGLEILTGRPIEEIDKKVNESLYKFAIDYKKFGETKKVKDKDKK
ncbi:MAG TPA: ATP-binding protein [Caldisericia bacterium]|nr:ATP-binding protein [Caldisericia bacterium]HPB34029.1 ATP-binding protein [Caldisericia bacterium]HQL66387.1 ATP-binding protein [Caldisericia bacterium]HQN47858.1 ATP-binding protein [Caldisericia bacterium]HQO99442.1 ATP-binding protein [Caldisericia bacterium]